MTLLVAPAVWGCQCGNIWSPNEALDKMPAAFVGQVVSLWPIAGQFHGLAVTLPMQTYRFRVLSSWNGVEGNTVSLLNQGSNCDLDFRVGAIYLVFARPDPDHPGYLYTSVCTPTRRVANVSAAVAGLPPPKQVSNAIDGLTESYARRLTRVGYASILIGSLYGGYSLWTGPLSSEARRVLTFTVAAVVVTVLLFPGIRLGRRRPWLMLWLIVSGAAFAIVAMAAGGYLMMRLVPYWWGRFL